VYNDIDVVVCTTAVTRGDFHKNIFEKYVQFLEGYNILWYINIDTLNIENIESIDYTLELIRSICTRDNLVLDITYKEGGTREAFHKSVQDLTCKAVKQTPKIGFLWLEDDWGLFKETTLKDVITSIQSFGISDYLQLARRVDRGKEISFNPGLWGPRLFFDVLYEKSQKPFPGPRSIIEKLCIEPIKVTTSKIHNYHKIECFEDKGRKWSSSLDLYRTFQFEIKPKWKI